MACVMEDRQLSVGDAVGKHVGVCDWHVNVLVAVHHKRDLADGRQAGVDTMPGPEPKAFGGDLSHRSLRRERLTATWLAKDPLQPGHPRLQSFGREEQGKDLVERRLAERDLVVEFLDGGAGSYRV